MEQNTFNFQESDEHEVDEEVIEVSSASGPKIYSISELTHHVKAFLEGEFPDVWVSGEVTNFRGRTGRHWYFGLKDAESQIAAVIFNAGGRKFPFDLEDGLEVICHGRLNVYPPRGTYSLLVDEIEPKGVGALQLAFEQLKKKLETEGLFAAEHKKPLPFLPQKIGVVTSPTGAAIRDIIHVLTRRFPGVGVLLAPVRVQGEGAAQEIAVAIEELNRRDDLDLLIVGRGGGSLEDLWAFNEEVVARAIFASRLPIISAVGHEIDFTIADFVADVRAPTPSAAAEIAVPVKEELLSRTQELRRQLAFALKQSTELRSKRVQELKERIKDPRARFPDLLLRVDGFQERLANAMRVGVDRRVQLFAKLTSNLNHLSPLNVLAKGYAVVQKGGRAVKSSRMLKAGDRLELLFYEGRAEAAVTRVEAPSRQASPPQTRQGNR